MATDSEDAFKATSNKPLAQLFKGAGIVLAAMLAGMLFSFVCRILIARFWTEAQYGTFTLGISLLQICTTIAIVGLSIGLPRNIAAARARAEYWKITEYVFASAAIVALVSILLAMSLFLASGSISATVFHDPTLEMPLRVLALTLPFSAFIALGVAILQGWGRVSGRAYFQFGLLNVSFLTLLAVAYYAKAPFIGIFYAYLTASIITLLVFILYAKRTLGVVIYAPQRRGHLFTLSVIDLIKFSLPLFVFDLVTTFWSWTDTLLLGILKSAAEVGLFSVALTLATLVTVPTNAVAFINLPVSSSLHVQHRNREIERNMVTMTKWICLIALPIAFLFLLFPESIINFSFGAKYTFASNALRILSLGAIFMTTTALVTGTLIAFGHARFTMISASASLALSATLDIVLIPRFSIEGAAAAATVALVSWYLVSCLRLYSVGNIHPFGQNLIKPLGVSFTALAVLYYTIGDKFHVTFLTLVLFFAFFVVIYGLAVLFTRSLDEQDIFLVTAIGDKIGIDTERLTRWMTKFV